MENTIEITSEEFELVKDIAYIMGSAFGALMYEAPRTYRHLFVDVFTQEEINKIEEWANNSARRKQELERCSPEFRNLIEKITKGR